MTNNLVSTIVIVLYPMITAQMGADRTILPASGHLLLFDMIDFESNNSWIRRTLA
jgi:hypothetical protein